jgi:hypothetical protein
MKMGRIECGKRKLTNTERSLRPQIPSNPNKKQTTIITITTTTIINDPEGVRGKDQSQEREPGGWTRETRLMR